MQYCGISWDPEKAPQLLNLNVWTSLRQRGCSIPTACKAPFQKWGRSELTLEVLAQNRLVRPAVGPSRTEEGGCWGLLRGGSRAVAQWTGRREDVGRWRRAIELNKPSYRALQAELLSSTSRRDTDTRQSSEAYNARPQSELSKSRATFLEINWLSLPLAGESCFHFFECQQFLKCALTRNYGISI